MEKAHIQAAIREPGLAAAACNSVYIVEDSDSIRARLIDMLREVVGVNVVGEAASADIAVAGILRTKPDAVVLDIQLAGSSGLDVLRQVHRLSPGIMFIVLTNYPNPQYRRTCMQEGASYFLDKTSEFSKVAILLSPAGAACTNSPPDTPIYANQTSH